jgi:hypothetical protein
MQIVTAKTFRLTPAHCLIADSTWNIRYAFFFLAFMGGSVCATHEEP